MIRFFILLFITPLAFGASFPCAKSTTDIERMICKSEKLSKLDDDLAVAFKSAAKVSSDATAIYLDQGAWLKKTRSACKDENCLQTEYEKRIMVVKNWNKRVQPDDSIYGNYIYPHEVGVYNQEHPDTLDSVKVVDCLEFKKISPNKAYVSMLVWFFNGHSCSIGGKFSLSNGVFIYDSPDDEVDCKLSISFKSQTIEVSDPKSGCTPTHCGARGDLSGIEFLRSKKSNSACVSD